MSWWTVLWYGKNSAKVAEERGDYTKASELYEKESKRRIPNPVSQASCARNRAFYYPSIPANDSYGKIRKAAECARKAGLYNKADELYYQIISGYGSSEPSDLDSEKRRLEQYYPQEVAEKIELRVKEHGKEEDRKFFEANYGRPPKEGERLSDATLDLGDHAVPETSEKEGECSDCGIYFPISELKEWQEGRILCPRCYEVMEGFFSSGT